MSGFNSKLRDELGDAEFRHSYVAENSRRGLAYQIRALRESREWSQAEFARQAGKPQSNIHRWEDPTYGKFSLSTLIEIAAIFDVALQVRFVGFETLLDSVANLRPENLAVLSYEQEAKNVEAARALRSQFGALAAFNAPIEQPVGRRSALSESPSETIKLPPFARVAAPAVVTAAGVA
jgi:transcriptional regulator with XRE-family HTH domain